MRAARLERSLASITAHSIRRQRRLLDALIATGGREGAAAFASDDDGDDADDAEDVVIADKGLPPVGQQVAGPDDEHRRVDRQQPE
jgi:streptomycin 6-kinase